MKNIKLWMTSDLKARVAELAYQRRTTVSALVREVVDDYVERGIAGAKLAELDPGGHEERAPFRIDQESWDKAKNRAAREQASLAAVIRRGLEVRAEKVSVP
jgi:predicted transcriptional regulator